MQSTIIIKKYKYCTLAIAISLNLLVLASCRKYLDAKPDQSLATPSTVQDLQAILDAKTMNSNFPFAGDIACDNYYLSATDWAALPDVTTRDTYVWNANAVNDPDWQYMYGVILNANIVISGADNMAAGSSSVADLNNAKGSAYFFRGYCHYALANVFTLPYNQTGNNSTVAGLPLKLKADITDPTVRSNLEDTYQQILSDLKTAAGLLPIQPSVKTRPSKPAAYGALARVYLVMGNYKQANLYADSCLQLQSALTDYNTVSTTASASFKIFNNEVIFHNTTSGRGGVLSPVRAITDSNLYASYASNDLRKKIFFKTGTKGIVFKGDYGGSSSSILFGGIAVDEMYLIRAETYARLGSVTLAVTDLNTLLTNRWAAGTYLPYSTTITADSALASILQERWKELTYRSGIRWSDLRRLNQDSRFVVTIRRLLNGITYTLVPGDKRYAFLFPVSVVQLTGIAQNSR
jgi:tetratricopeptide (TPR) repeat protein